MIAAAVAPTISVRTIIDACNSLRATLMNTLPLERLADAEMNAPMALFRSAVDDQPRDRIELVAEVESHGTDRRLVAEPGARRIVQIVQSHAPVFCPHVAAVHEHDPPEAAVQGTAQLGTEREHRVAADRQPRAAERAHFVAAPPADAGGTAEEKFLGKRHLRGVAARRVDVAELQTIRQHDPLADRQVMPAVG